MLLIVFGIKTSEVYGLKKIIMLKRSFYKKED